jgi:hypothetical protein
MNGTFGRSSKSEATWDIESSIACLFTRRIVNGASKLETIIFLPQKIGLLELSQFITQRKSMLSLFFFF